MIEFIENLMRILNLTTNATLLLLALMAGVYIRGVMRQEQRDKASKGDK